MTKNQKETRLFLTSILAVILAASTLAMVTNVNNEEHQVFAQNMTQTEGKGIPFVIQGTAQSTPDTQAPGHEPYHQIAMVLPPRQDGKIYTGTVTYTASLPLEVAVVHPFNQSIAQNATGLPIGGAQPEGGAVTLLHGLEGSMFDTDDFSGSSVYFHSRSSQPFTVAYTVVGKIVDPMPLPT
jgi:hypothetical protein